MALTLTLVTIFVILNAKSNEDLKFKSHHLHDNGKAQKPENEILLLQDVLPCFYCYCFISEKGVLKCIY